VKVEVETSEMVPKQKPGMEGAPNAAEVEGVVVVVVAPIVREGAKAVEKEKPEKVGEVVDGFFFSSGRGVVFSNSLRREVFKGVQELEP
jgi:hypothetical protein